MKILHINTNDTGGAAIACIRQHLALLENGVESHLLTLYKTRKDVPNHMGYLEIMGPRAGTFPLLRLLRTRIKSEFDKHLNKKEITYSRNLKALQWEASQTTDCFSFVETSYRIDLIPGIEDFDVINLHWTAFFLDWRSFFLSPKIKSVVWTLHDMHPFTGGYHYSAGYDGYKEDDADPPFLRSTFNPGFAKEQLSIKKKIMSETKVQIKVTAPSKWLYDCSKESSLFSKYEHHHFPYSLNINRFKALDRSFCRQVLDIPQDKNVILFVSDHIHNERKGFSLLLEALSMFEDDRLVLCCIGNTSDLNISDKYAIQLGNISDEKIMSLAYNAADAFVLPSREDNMPNVALESLCSGTPIISFKIGAMPDMIINGVNGILCDSISPGELKAAIQSLLNNLTNFDKDKISRSAASKYAPAVQATSYIELYKGLYN